MALAFVTGDEVYSYRLDPGTGGLEKLQRTDTGAPESFCALGPAGEYLYTVRGGEGLAAAYAVGDDGELDRVNSQPTEGEGPCHCAVDATGSYLLVAHYNGGSVATLPIRDDGGLGGVADFVAHEGSGPNEERQEAPHPHSINPGPENRLAYVPDLGTDEIRVYDLDLDGGRLRPADPPAVELAPGAGPRHFDVHPTGEYAYVINELADTITAFERDGEGRLAPTGTVSTLPDGFEGQTKTADIHVHPSGEFLYGSNRGHDSIAVFDISTPASPERVAIEPTRGEWPRNFALGPDGEYLFVENRDTDDVTTFEVDPDTGGIDPNGEVADCGAPICMTFLAE
ncbi:MAG: lactonase family protein [Halobacteriaceae archaeon]